MRRPIALLAVLALTACGADGSAPPSGEQERVAAAAALPAPVEPALGHTYWAVYLAVGEHPQLEEASSWLRARGLPGDPGPLSCDEGAAEVLGEEDGPERVAVFFDMADDANLFAVALDGPPEGIGQITAAC